MSEIKIRDLYTGKPDAKDEINFEGLEEFIKTFVVADHFQLDSLLYGNNCFITGFKGTGKTALLFYLDNKLKDEDPITCTSFIFLYLTTLIISKKPGNTGISRDIRTEFTTDLLLSD